MVLVTGNWRIWLAGLAASLAIFAVVYFTAIKPSTDTADQAVKSGLQQTQQAINQAEKQAPSSSGAPNAGQAQQQVHSAAALSQCLAAAGINTTAIQACHTTYTK